MRPREWPTALKPFFAEDQATPALRAFLPPKRDAAPMQLLVLDCGQQRLAIDILQVAEVQKQPPLTHVPRMPSYHIGVASVRGVIMPVVHLGGVLGLSASPQSRPHRFERIVVLRGPAPLGLAVDRIVQVVRLEQHQLMPAKDEAAAHLPWAAAFAPLPFGLTAVLAVDALEHALRPHAGASRQTDLSLRS